VKTGGKVVIDDVKMVVCNALQIDAKVRAMDAATPLLGAIPELDSMVVVTVITGLEERFGISVEDDEIGAATFATLGTLTAFVEQKLGA
jgi:acyl carrier protein